MAKSSGSGERSMAEQEMEEMFGFVPEFCQHALPAQAHDDAWATMRDFQLGETALPNKVKELIGLAVAAHIKCRYCIHFHTQAARAFGASDEELREACFMGGFTVQMSNALTGTQVDLDGFKEEVDKAIAHLAANSEQMPAH
jgi:AhpD family alkylhydroperoxidase